MPVVRKKKEKNILKVCGFCKCLIFSGFSYGPKDSTL